MDFGKVVNTADLVHAESGETVKCKCAKDVAPVNLVQCDKGITDKPLEYAPYQKALLKNCQKPVWVFPKDTFPPKNTESPGSCAAVFRNECIPPETRKDFAVMCAGDQTAAFDAYSVVRQVREVS